MISFSGNSKFGEKAPFLRNCLNQVNNLMMLFWITEVFHSISEEQLFGSIISKTMSLLAIFNARCKVQSFFSFQVPALRRTSYPRLCATQQECGTT